MTRESAIVEEILRSRPLERDGMLIVHSAFRGLSRAGFRAESFCEAIMRAMPAGTVLMPAMTWRTVTPSSPVFDEMATPGHTGALAEVFRLRYATARSLHPTHSVAGAGPLAGRLLATHHLGTTPCPASSPYGLMRGFPVHILMLGVGLDRCTAIHHAEETVAEDIYVRPMSEAEDYDLIDRRGVTHKVKTRRHRRLPRDFPKFEAVLAARGELAEGIAFATRWTLFSARDLYTVVFDALRADARATLITETK